MNYVNVRNSLNYVNLLYVSYHAAYIYIQGVTGGKGQTSGGCSLC